MSREKKREYWVIGLLFFCGLVMYWRVFFSGNAMLSSMQGDIVNYAYASSHLIFGKGLFGPLSLWNPYLLGGFSLIGHPSTALFYPLNFVFFLLPVHVAVNISFIINTFLCGLCFYLYARYLPLGRGAAFLGAVTYMLAGHFSLRIYAGHLQTLQTLPWLPLLFLYFEMYLRERRVQALVAGGAVLGIQILAAHAQYSYYSVLALSAYAVVSAGVFLRKHEGRKEGMGILAGYAAMVALGMSIAAVKLIPAAEFLRYSDRQLYSYQSSASWALPLENLITFVIPEFFGNMTHFPYWAKYNFWEMCGYAGIVPLFLAVSAGIYRQNKQTLFFSLLAVLALGASLGPQSFLFRIFYRILPGFDKFRGHSKLIVIVIFSLAVLAAYGMEWLTSSVKDGRRMKRVIAFSAIAAGVAVVSLIVVYLGYDFFLALWQRSWSWRFGQDTEFSHGAFSCALLGMTKSVFLIAAFFLLVFLGYKKSIADRTVKRGLIFLILIDLWLFAANYTTMVPVRRCYWRRDVVDFLRSTEAPSRSRIAALTPAFFANRGIVDGLYFTNGYDSIESSRHRAFFRSVDTSSIDTAAFVRLLSLSNTRFILTASGVQLKQPAYRLAYQKADVKIWENTFCLPKAFIVHHARRAKTDTQVMAALLDPQFDPLTTVVLEEELPDKSEAVSEIRETEAVVFGRDSSDSVTIKVRLSEPGYLVLADQYFPGWQATVHDSATGNSFHTRIYAANYLFRAVYLDRGEHTVVFRFAPVSFYLGLSVSAITVLAAVFFLLSRRRQRQAKTV